MLNDVARPTRLLLLAQTTGYGVMAGSALALAGGHWVLGIVLLGSGLVVVVAALSWFVVWSRRSERALVADVGRGSVEIVSGRVSPLPAPARMVRRRVLRSTRGHLLGRDVPVAPPAMMVVATALAPGGARRVAALVPADLGLDLRRGGPLSVVLHPGLPEVAVLDPGAGADRIAALDSDPRWRTERLPTDRTVVGGWTFAAAAAVLGLVAGVGADALVVALAG